MRSPSKSPGFSAFRAAAVAAALPIVAAASLEAQAAIGLSGVRAQAFFNEEIDNNPPQAGDSFGFALAAGDFNGDGAQDLATGIPGDDGPADLPLQNAGAVTVRWGVAGAGLATAPPPTLLSLYAAGGQAQAHQYDRFGYALAAGDFNGDGRDDLAVGIPGFFTNTDEYYDSGAVQVHYGEPGGIQVVGEHWFQSGGDNNVPDPPDPSDFLGQALAAGDFDGDGFDDLAIGAPQGWCGLFSCVGGGAVVVLHGGVGGLIPVVGYVIQQGVLGVPDESEDPDDFGYALAAGNFNGDERCLVEEDVLVCRPIDDLAMSAPGEDGIGAVLVMLGSENQLIFANSGYLGQGDLGGSGEADDRFGDSLAAGNFNGDCCDDLSIGTPSEDLGASADAGEITILYGTSTPLVFTFENLTQGGIFGSTVYDQAGDQFGFALGAGDFDGDGHDDLAIGQPGENVAGSDRGGATILMGSSGGLYDRFRFVAAGINGVQPGVQNDSKMGFALGVGDFDGNGFSDLAIGIPNRDQNAIGDAGAEAILYGALFADGFASGNDDFWSESNP